MVPLSSSDDLPLLLLDRYLAGETTAAESAIVEAWIGNSVGRRGELEFLRRAVTEPGAALTPSDVDAAVAGVLAASGLAGRAPRTSRLSSESGMEDQSYRAPRLRPRGVRRGSAWRSMTTAASVVVALGVGLTIGVGRHGVGVRAVGREYRTAAGQRLSVTLVDGTQLTLAPASQVRVAADYGRPGAAREVALEGEVYVAVVHDGAHPFMVRAQGTVARDIGTVFDVRAYVQDAGARIAVAEGAVAVSTSSGCRTSIPALDQRAGAVRNGPLLPPAATDELCSAEARAGDVVTVADKAVTVKHGADIAALTAWRQGGLVFDNTPLPDVMRDVGRTYDVEVAIADSGLAKRTVTASFRGDEAVDDVLEAIAHAVGARVERTEHRAVLTRRTAGRAMPVPVSTAAIERGAQ
jgi:ferric-dicitrate binding protein FerR (iron transport regulator)